MTAAAPNTNNPVAALGAAVSAVAHGIGAALAGLPLPRRPARTAQHVPPPPPPPVTRETVGAATWTLLHSVAASYPDAPSRAQRRAADQLIASLATLYPCAECAAHLRAHLAARPPDTRTGPALRVWACALHNDVNADLGKPQASCAPAALAARWPALECEVDGKSACALKR